MNLFVSVIPKNKAFLNKYKKSIETAASITVPFHNMEHRTNIWMNDHVVAANFSIHEDKVAIKKYSTSDHDTFCTFNGIPSIEEFHTTNRPWSDIIFDKYKNRTLEFDKVSGYYNFLCIDAYKAQAYTSITRSEPIYWTETEECFAVGNRASLVYAAAHASTKFEYNLDALISICTIGWQVHDLVQFEGVKLLDNGANITFTPDGKQINYHNPYQFEEVPMSEQPRMNKIYDEIYDDLSQEFINGLKSFKGFSDKLVINLTGGKDSRVVAAFSKEAGLDFTTVTSGGPEDRDVIVAKEIADIIGVEHTSSAVKKKANPDEIQRVDIFELLQRQVFQSDGTSNIYDNCYPVRLNPSVQFTGHAGACYKGGYGNSKKALITDRKQALSFIDNLSLHNRGIILTKEADERQVKINEAIVDQYLDSSFPIKNFHDYMYTVYREGRAMANGRQASAYGSFQNSPFLNDKALKIAWELPVEYRRNNMLYYNLLYRINPQLAKHRFADSRWDFEEKGPREGTSMEEWLSREPLPPGPKGQQIRNWRAGYDEYLRPIIKDYLLSDQNNRIFEIIDYEKLTELLNKPGPTTPNIIRSVFGIMGVSYFVNNEWFKQPEQSFKDKIINIFKK
ncbi:asparagine synthase-related protein [Alkalihalophilus marmarensis]|uniref:asparagine synthase-related protein n=1 Tax=Alkalihalophilus marmarensis TaxID=521377 RepID=UPI002E23D2F6|nr:asparagine synthase-related protein [Alkalihalophilus marmarensis]MED1602986.1 asparagine synthase-related protein [Alkalihalophilus marmarensis]